MSKMIEKMQQKMTRVDLVLLLYLAFSILHAYKLFLEIFLHLDRLVNFYSMNCDDWNMQIRTTFYAQHFCIYLGGRVLSEILSTVCNLL